jgi:hypothetical protein
VCQGLLIIEGGRNPHPRARGHRDGQLSLQTAEWRGHYPRSGLILFNAKHRENAFNTRRCRWRYRPSVMWRRVSGWVLTDVSKTCSASIYKDQSIILIGTLYASTCKHHVLSNCGKRSDKDRASHPRDLISKSTQNHALWNARLFTHKKTYVRKSIFGF